MINKSINNKKQPQPQPQPGAEPALRKARTIKLGVDDHLDVYVVGRIVDWPKEGSGHIFLWC